MRKWLCIVLICLLCAPAFAETVQDQALLFIQEAGIEADSVMRIENSIIVTLTDGGTASLWASGDFDPLDLSWRFSGATDADVARYLDHALAQLSTLAQRIPEDREGLPAAELQRARSLEAIVEKALTALDNTGEQGLRVLTVQLAETPEHPLNPLREKLAARLADIMAQAPQENKD